MRCEQICKRIRNISKRCRNKLEEFSQSFDEITTLNPVSVTQTDTNDERYLKNLCKNIKPTIENSLKSGYKIVDNNRQILQEKQSEVKQLEHTLAKLNEDYKDKERNVSKLKKRCQTFEQKIKCRQNLRDTIKTYKLLTGTSFAYQKDKTIGYIKQDKSLGFEVFDYSNTHISQEEIVKRIWILIEKVINDNTYK